MTKKLGVGIICTANRVGEASEAAMHEAIKSMTTLNKYASEICRKYDVHACTDVTGFSFLGHLHEMLDGKLNCCIDASEVPVIEEAHRHADEFLLTAAGQRNRNHTGPFVEFRNIPFSMEEILFDPQTSGGLLAAVKAEQANTAPVECADDDQNQRDSIKHFLQLLICFSPIVWSADRNICREIFVLLFTACLS